MMVSLSSNMGGGAVAHQIGVVSFNPGTDSTTANICDPHHIFNGRDTVTVTEPGSYQVTSHVSGTTQSDKPIVVEMQQLVDGSATSQMQTQSTVFVPNENGIVFVKHAITNVYQVTTTSSGAGTTFSVALNPPQDKPISLRAGFLQVQKLSN
jgi:filamentous hemagglutinin family protein